VTLGNFHAISRRCLATLVVLTVIAPALAAQKDNGAGKAPVHIKTAKELQNAIAQVDELCAAAYAKQKLASLTVGVVSGPNLVWTKSYGLADIENNIPATKDSTYRIGSITKEFTAVMLLQLVKQGKVHFSDPVEKYFPEVKQIPVLYPAAPPITLLQLATHTAGLAKEPDNMKVYTTGPVADWEKTLISALPHLKCQYEPGTRFNYSNIGYAILGAALSRAAGEPYIQYVQTHILAPLGMTHTAFEQNADILKSLAKGYMVKGNSADPSEAATDLRNGRGYKVPNGALFTTVGDLAHFLSFQMGDGPESILPKSLVAEDFSRIYSADADLGGGYGIGFSLVRKNELIFAGHGGSVDGYRAGALFNPASHTGFIWLRNALGPGIDFSVPFAALKVLSQ
jgi:CubicO group peptidase (beta-lactamase class C family)